MKKMYFSFLIAALFTMTTQLEAMNFSDPDLPPLKPCPPRLRNIPNRTELTQKESDKARRAHSAFVRYLKQFTGRITQGDLTGAAQLASQNQDYGRASYALWARVNRSQGIEEEKIKQDLLRRTQCTQYTAKPNIKKNK